MSILAEALAAQMTALLRVEFAKLASTSMQPMLLDVKQAAVYLGRSEQSIQRLIRLRDIPVVRVGRRVHLHRRDMDTWIDNNKE